MRNESYVVRIPSESALSTYFELCPYYHVTMRSVPTEQKEMTIKEIAEYIENDKWAVFPVSAKIDDVKSYRNIGMKIVFIKHNYRDFKMDYKEYMGVSDGN